MRSVTFISAILISLTACSGPREKLTGKNTPATASHVGEPAAETWKSRGRSVTLHLGPDLAGDFDRTASYYKVSHSRQHLAQPENKDDLNEVITPASFISSEDYSSRKESIKPQVFFSPTGETILIDEDVSDASPSYQFILIHFNPDIHYVRDEVRHLELPTVPTATYPGRPSIISISDESITYRFYGEHRSKTVKFTNLRDDMNRP